MGNRKSGDVSGGLLAFLKLSFPIIVINPDKPPMPRLIARLIESCLQLICVHLTYCSPQKNAPVLFYEQEHFLFGN